MRIPNRPPLVIGALVAALILLAFGVSVVNAEGLGPSWNATTGLNYELQSCAADADLSSVYCIGGLSGIGYTNAVNYASPSVSGTISKWASTTVYPNTVTGQSCLIYQFYIYCVGGYDGSARLNIAYYAQLSPTGLGSWQPTTSYPSNVHLQSCVAYSGYVYCVGGFDGLHYFNATYYATLSTSGGIGAWAKTTTFPTPVESQSCVVSSGYIYCIGGASNSTIGTNAVYYAPLSSSGGIGVWSKTAAYPTPVYGQSCVAQSGFVYCVGGLTGSGYTNAVRYAPLSSSGVGNWFSTTAYPSNVYAPSCVILSSYVYCVGGFDGSYTISSAYSNLLSLTSTTTVTLTSTLTKTPTMTQTTAQTVAPNKTTTATVTVTIQSFSFATSTVTATATYTTTATAVGTTQTQSQSGGIAPTLEAGVAAGGLVAGVLLTLVISRLRRAPPVPPEEPEEAEEPEDQVDSATDE